MNVKSFVNGLDPENTVKGYYDENDQLVMVEPEVSGGGIRTATVTINDEPEVEVWLPVIDSGGRVAGYRTDESDVYTVPLSESGAEIYVNTATDPSITVSGDVAADIVKGYYTVTGDCTITIESK